LKGIVSNLRGGEFCPLGKKKRGIHSGPSEKGRRHRPGKTFTEKGCGFFLRREAWVPKKPEH